MLEIRFSPEAQKEIHKIPIPDARMIVSKIDALAEFPYKVSSRQLEWYAPLRRIRAWNYRVVYFIERNTLEIYLIWKRNDDEIYKKLRRKK